MKTFKSNLTFVFILVVLLHVYGDGAADKEGVENSDRKEESKPRQNCTSVVVPKVKMNQCCKLPAMADTKVVTDVQTKMKADESVGYLKLCKFHSELFKAVKVVKNDEIDLDVAWKYVNEKLNEPEWNNLAKDIFDYCTKDFVHEIPEIQRRSNFTKETCDIKYHATAECLELYMISECPAKNIIQKEGCAEGRKFVQTCHEDLDKMEELMEYQDRQ